jgi:hypothetical protein
VIPPGAAAFSTFVAGVVVFVHFATPTSSSQVETIAADFPSLRFGFMAGGAIECGLAGAMAIHAAAHREICFFGQALALSYRSVAGLTAGAGFGVDLVAEVNPARNSIDAHPGNILFGGFEAAQFLDGGRIGSDCPMAGHALGNRGEGDYFAGIRSGVAIAAFEFGGFTVLFVAERNRLRGRVVLR